MITRFMDVDLSLVPGVLGKASGRLGGAAKVALTVSAGAGGMPRFKGGGSDIESELANFARCIKLIRSVVQCRLGDCNLVRVGWHRRGVSIFQEEIAAAP
jgi:hypothetical protein